MLLTAIFALAFSAWAWFFYIKLNTLFTVHLKYIFEQDVNKIAQYPVAARYDIVNVKHKFWRHYFIGLFLIPFRAPMWCGISFSYTLVVTCIMKMAGIKYQGTQNVQNPHLAKLLMWVTNFFTALEFLAVGFG